MFSFVVLQFHSIIMMCSSLHHWCFQVNSNLTASNHPYNRELHMSMQTFWNLFCSGKTTQTVTCSGAICNWADEQGTSCDVCWIVPWATTWTAPRLFGCSAKFLAAETSWLHGQILLPWLPGCSAKFLSAETSWLLGQLACRDRSAISVLSNLASSAVLPFWLKAPLGDSHSWLMNP